VKAGKVFKEGFFLFLKV